MAKSMAVEATEVVLDTPPDGVPLPTASMVTVRLSDDPSQLSSVDVVEEDGKLRESIISCRTRSRTLSGSSATSRGSDTTTSVDWEGLEKTERQEPKDDATDESTALLLARLEQENNALATDPKSALANVRAQAKPRPPSIHQLKRLVTGPQRRSLRYSMVPAPQMTELEFWAALVQDYTQTAQRLPTLTSNKIRGGVPPPLRGVVWPSIAGAQDPKLFEDFERLANELSPYDGLIGKDVGRSFPNVDMFREKDGEGQQMLRRVLKAFSLYDEQIGYCQGLGFVVGPLLMHMNEAEAFAVLVRLMEHYNLRSCYTPDLAGLHLHIYQFQTLLSRHLPELSARLTELNVEPLYVSQWFLSFFAVTCPLPMLLRIYDIILAEGATETLMRVALSLMQRNQKKLLAFTEFEEIMQFLLSRSLWDTYAQHADDMVADFVALTNLVSRENLLAIESDYKQARMVTTSTPLKTAAASLLGRFWTGSVHAATKSSQLGLNLPAKSTLRKTASGHSLTLTIETTSSEVSTAPTETSDPPRTKSEAHSFVSVEAPYSLQATDRSLHNQIEDLLTALGKLQHQQLELARDLQREREEREEERILAERVLEQLRKQRTQMQELVGDEIVDQDDPVGLLIEKATKQFSPMNSRRISILQTKHQMRDSITEWKERHDAEAARCQDLMRQLDLREAEQGTLRDELREARQRIQDSYKDKQRLERSMHELKQRASVSPESPSDLCNSWVEKTEMDFKSPARKGLREFRLGKPEQQRMSVQFNKRTSSLNTANSISGADQLQSPESLLLELVNAKTAEAVAKQELEETKSKLDALRRIISGGGAVSPGSRQLSVPVEISPTIIPLPPTPPAKSSEPVKPVVPTTASGVGGFFSGWGKRGV